MLQVNGIELSMRYLSGRFFDLDLPRYMIEPLWLYLEHGIEPGSFLSAVLSNDLRGAVGNADENNKRVLHEWVRLLYNDCPSQAWGSKEKMQSWMQERRKLNRERKS